MRRAEACDCRRLTRPLEHWEDLPTHVCPGNEMVACEQWAAETQEVQARYTGKRDPAIINFGDRFIYVGHDAWPYSFTQSPNPKFETFRGPSDFNAAGTIHVVIRQWAEVEDEKLARALLEKNDRVRALLATGEPLPKLWERTGQDVRETQSPPSTLTPGEWAALVEDFRAVVLPGLMVPCTPGTARFLLWKLHGMCQHGSPVVPTRGVLVTSLLVQPSSYEWPSKKKYWGDHLYEISGSSRWDSATILKRAQTMVNTHRTWLQEQAISSLEKFDATRYNAGREPEQDPLRHRIEAVLSGSLSEAAFKEEAKQLERARRSEAGVAAPNPQELNAAVKAAMKRLKTALQAQQKRERESLP